MFKISYILVIIVEFFYLDRKSCLYNIGFVLVICKKIFCDMGICCVELVVFYFFYENIYESEFLFDIFNVDYF